MRRRFSSSALALNCEWAGLQAEVRTAALPRGMGQGHIHLCSGCFLSNCQPAASGSRWCPWPTRTSTLSPRGE